jgi:CheY-like chemotaxis protein
MKNKKTPNFQIPSRILVVDDVPSNLIVAKGLMELFGVTVYLVNNGQKAIDMIQEEKIRYWKESCTSGPPIAESFSFIK